MITDIKQREGANRGNIMFELRRCDWLRLALSADAILDCSDGARSGCSSSAPPRSVPRNQPPITFNAVTAAAQRDRLVWILPRLTSS